MNITRLNCRNRDVDESELLHGNTCIVIIQCDSDILYSPLRHSNPLKIKWGWWTQSYHISSKNSVPKFRHSFTEVIASNFQQVPNCSIFSALCHPVWKRQLIQASQWWRRWGQCCSEWKLTDFFPKPLHNIDAQKLLRFPWTYQLIARHARLTWSSKAFGWEAKKTQHWTWLANLWALPWPWKSTEQQRCGEYCKGWVSITQLAANGCGCWLCVKHPLFGKTVPLLYFVLSHVPRLEATFHFFSIFNTTKMYSN